MTSDDAQTANSVIAGSNEIVMSSNEFQLVLQIDFNNFSPSNLLSDLKL